MKKNPFVSIIALFILIVGVIIAALGCNSDFFVSANSDMATTPVSDNTQATVSFEEAFNVFRENPRATLTGYLLKDGYLYTGSTPIDSIHTHGLEIGGQTLVRTSNYEFIYNCANNTVYVCYFGNVESIVLPQNTDYCGINDWLGLICRVGNDIYQINIYQGDYAAKKIASDVEYVISCEYAYNQEVDNSIILECPLFLMKDGSLKVYDGAELHNPLHEGGYLDIVSPIC